MIGAQKGGIRGPIESPQLKETSNYQSGELRQYRKTI